MEKDLLEDFKSFLARYREAWNSLEVEKLMVHASENLQVRWATSEGVSDWGYAQAKEGWRQAFNQYEGKQAEWHFEDILTSITEQQEAVAVFWVTFSLNGSMTDHKMLFMETFQKEDGAWKKIREYVENPFTRE